MAFSPKTKRIIFLILNLILAYNLSCQMLYVLNFIIKHIFNITIIGSESVLSIIIGSILFIGSLYPSYKITRRILLILIPSSKR